MRKTKIVCTLGPATDREGVLRQMLEAGMNVARFNFSHGSHAEHKGRCALALKNHRKELCECEPEELAAFARDLARASGAVKELWGCDKINLGSFGDTNPHLHFHIVPKYEGGFEFGGSFAITNPEPVLLSEGEYQEMIAALREKLGM